VHPYCEIGRFMLCTVSINSNIIVITVKTAPLSSSSSSSSVVVVVKDQEILYCLGRNCTFLSDSKPLASDGHL